MQPILRMVQRSSLVLGALALVAMAAAPASSQIADRCTSARLKAVGKEVKALLGCSGRLATQGPGPAGICTIRADGKFTAAYAKPQGCITPPEFICHNIILDLQAKLRTLLPDDNACEAARLRAAGKKVAAKVGCYVRAVAKGVSVDPTCLTKANNKFSAAFTRVSGCADGGGEVAVESLADKGLFRLVATDMPDGSGHVKSICTSACSEPIKTIDQCGETVLGMTSGHSTLEGTCASETASSPENVYPWTPKASGVASIDTCGGTTDFDTVLYMRSTNCDSGSEVACDNDACGVNGPSRIRPSVSAGTTYFIFVDGFNGALGNYTLTVAPPGTCGSPIFIPASGGSFADSTTTGCPTQNGTGMMCSNSTLSREKVYEWTPSASGMATIETCGGTTDFDTVLYIRSTDPVTNTTCDTSGNEVACGDNDVCGLNGLASRITMMVEAGTTYFIFVDGNDGNPPMPPKGNYTLTVTPPAGTCINPYIIPPDGHPFRFDGTTSGVGAQAGTCGGGGPEKVYRWAPTTPGIWTIKTCDGITNFKTVLYVRGTNCDNIGDEVVCDSGSCGIGGIGSQITVTAPGTFFIFVDGVTGDDAGNYTLMLVPGTTTTTTTSATTTTT